MHVSLQYIIANWLPVPFNQQLVEHMKMQVAVYKYKYSLYIINAKQTINNITALLSIDLNTISNDSRSMNNVQIQSLTSIRLYILYVIQTIQYTL